MTFAMFTSSSQVNTDIQAQIGLEQKLSVVKSPTILRVNFTTPFFRSRLEHFVNRAGANVRICYINDFAQHGCGRVLIVASPYRCTRASFYDVSDLVDELYGNLSFSRPVSAFTLDRDIEPTNKVALIRQHMLDAIAVDWKIYFFFITIALDQGWGKIKVGLLERFRETDQVETLDERRQIGGRFNHVFQGWPRVGV
jgi:hypothetical protein